MATGGLVLSACSRDPENAANKEGPALRKEEGDEEVSPAEDLMREHGVLKRVLLIYKESIRRINARQDFPPDALKISANLIRRFIEDYHEILEEDFETKEHELFGEDGFEKNVEDVSRLEKALGIYDLAQFTRAE